MDLISIIAIIVIISKIVKKAGNAADKVENYGAPRNAWGQSSGSSGYGNRKTSSAQNEQWKQLARQNIEKARQRAAEKLREVEYSFETGKTTAGTYQMPKQTTLTTPAYEQMNLQQMARQQGFSESEVYPKASQYRKQENKSAMQQVYAGRMEARKTSILERAKANAEEDKADVTLQTMEAEHNHSERVSPAEHYHPEDVIPESMLGTIEDLMIKGYDGNLCFERDFVGEAMDMISRFTVPSDVPDFKKGDVA